MDRSWSGSLGSPLQISGKVAVGVVGDSKFSRAPMYWAHRAVIFAIAQLSCLLWHILCIIFRLVSCSVMWIILGRTLLRTRAKMTCDRESRRRCVCLPTHLRFSPTFPTVTWQSSCAEDNITQPNIFNKLWRPFGPPQLDLLMWKSTVLLRVNLKHMKRKMTVVFHFYTFVSRNYVYLGVIL